MRCVFRINALPPRSDATTIMFFRLQSLGVWRLLFVALVRAQPEGRQGPSAGVLWHRWNVPVLAVSGARALSVGRHRGRQRPRPRIRTVYGRRLEDDHDWWRVSFAAVCCVETRKFMIYFVHLHSEGQAIWMDENIRFGKTDRCQTFNNPPLCPSGDFEIRVLEVYGFVGA